MIKIKSIFLHWGSEGGASRLGSRAQLLEAQIQKVICLNKIVEAAAKTNENSEKSLRTRVQVDRMHDQRVIRRDKSKRGKEE